jgi:hypothetical protein
MTRCNKGETLCENILELRIILFLFNIGDRRTTAGNSSTRRHSSVTSNARNTQAFGNDSSKLSKLQPPEESFGSNWLCSHYKRQCYVKFECCEKFWPCHRCHNNQSTCGQKKLKSRDTQMVKCVHCNKVQPVITIHTDLSHFLLVADFADFC